MPDFETDPDAELEVRHSPDDEPPYYYVAGRILALAPHVDEVMAFARENEFGDLSRRDVPGVDGIAMVDFDQDRQGEDAVVAFLRLWIERGAPPEEQGIAPDYCFLPSSHKNVYWEDPPQPAPAEELAPMNPPCPVKVGLVDVGFVDLGSRTEMMTLPDDYDGYPAVASDTEADFGHGESVAWLISRYAPGALLEGESVSKIDAAEPAMHGAVTDSELARAVLALVEAGCQLITCTFGCTEDPAFPILATKSSVDLAVEAGKLVIAAAGNEGSPDLAVYPAAWDSVLAVGANVQGDNGWVRAEYSNFSGDVDVYAPGSHVVPFVQHAPSYGRARVTGTSFAVPVVAGVIADCWCRAEGLSKAEAEQLLRGLELDVIGFGPGA